MIKEGATCALLVSSSLKAKTSAAFKFLDLRSRPHFHMQML